MSTKDIEILIFSQNNTAGELATQLLSESNKSRIQIVSDHQQLLNILKTNIIPFLLIDERYTPFNKYPVSSYTTVRNEYYSSLLSKTESVLGALKENFIDHIYRHDINDYMLGYIVKLTQMQKNEGKGARRTSVFSVIRGRFNGIIGSSSVMNNIYSMILRISQSDRPVLIYGPSGSGKELVAHAIHRLSSYYDGQFMDLNCAALPESLIESQLFGYEKGAFTGANQSYSGYLDASKNGTLFLDEIAEMSLSVQSKLLRVLEGGTYRMLGSNTIRYFDGRVIAATHNDLEESVHQKKFREDLFYRLNVLKIDIPSLSERKSDIPALVQHFTEQQNREFRFSHDSIDIMKKYHWPGNVRELRNIVERIAVMSDEEEISPSTVKNYIRPRSITPVQRMEDIARNILELEHSDKLHAISNALINEALRITNGNKSAAARLIGVHRKVIERRT